MKEFEKAIADSIACWNKELNHAESQAFAALSRYKFIMFGYWAALWVHLNRISNLRRPNPFKELVSLARGISKPIDRENRV